MLHLTMAQTVLPNKLATILILTKLPMKSSARKSWKKYPKFTTKNSRQKIVGEDSKFRMKIEVLFFELGPQSKLFENGNFVEKSNFCWKIEILVKNKNFVEKSKFCWKIEILVKNKNFVEKSKFCWKIKIVLKNPNFVQKSKFCSKIEILLKNRNCVEKSKFCWKIEIVLKNRNFVEKSKLC